MGWEQVSEQDDERYHIQTLAQAHWDYEDSVDLTYLPWNDWPWHKAETPIRRREGR